MARNRNTGEYTVIKGDTLSEIAESIGINYEDLMEINDKESSYIQPGDKLKVPEENVYTIKQGDTLSEIGVKYHMKTSSLATLNGTDVRHIIYVGDKLIVNNPESAEGKTETTDDN